MKAMCGLVLLLTACHQEPTIVIKFEPNDLAQANVVAKVDAGDKIAVDGGAVAKKADAADTAAKPGAACKAATDCVAVKVDCCDCSNGGAHKVVSKAEAAKLEKERKTQCKGTMCPAMISNDPSCSKKADCVAGHCVLR